MAENKILAGLNPKQRQAVKITHGPLLINAVAGSGKTRTLTRHVAYLIRHNHIKPWNILAITFTNKAANEMKERINQLLDTNRSGVWVSTFHALGIAMLRNRVIQKNGRYISNAELLGYKPSFTIAGPSSQRTLVKHIEKGVLNVSTKQYSPRDIVGAISSAKNDLITPADYVQNHSKHSPFQNIVAKVYPIYQDDLRKENNMDFDDLIMKPVILFKKFPQILSHYQHRFLYIHVDEYQDTNEAQYQMVSLLAQRYKNICVVGDADQSIYGWRGANIQNILNFKKDYPTAHVVLMNENYRSTSNILKVANCVISNNKNRPQDKKLWTQNPEGKKVGLYRAGSGKEEANFVTDKIIENHRLGYQYNDFAVLYRTNAQSRTLEEKLRIKAIPYTIIGGLKFYDRKEIQDTLAYLSLIVNPSDDTSFERVINTPKRGIGATSVDKLIAFASQNNYSLFQATQHVDACSTLGTRPKNKIKSFCKAIEDLQSKAHKQSITDTTKDMWEETNYLPYLRKKAKRSLQAQTRISNLEEFTSDTMEYDKKHHGYPLSTRLSRFLSDVALISAQDTEDDSKPQVTLMTIHASKGLEFPIVFIVGLEEGIFPLSHGDEGIENLDEERRLCYVAITRAEKKLYLSYATYRLMYGQPQSNPPSRFLEEINPHLLRRVTIESLEQQQKRFFNQTPPSDKPF